MYRLEWIERRKLEAPSPTFAEQTAKVSPVVWKLGWTSFLTDISSEMVNSALPVYLVIYLHQSPLQYGAIDGVYNGFAVVLVSLAAGLMADRWKRTTGYRTTGRRTRRSTWSCPYRGSRRALISSTTTA